MITRHKLLERTIGTFKEEDEAYNLVTSLMILIPSSLFILSTLEMVLFLIYNTKMHPWKALLVSQQELLDSMESSDEESDESAISDDSLDTDMKEEETKERIRSNFESSKDECISEKETSSQAETDCDNEKKKINNMANEGFEEEVIEVEVAEEEEEEDDQLSTRL